MWGGACEKERHEASVLVQENLILVSATAKEEGSRIKTALLQL